MSTMWSQGRERRAPKNAGTRFSCYGSYRGSPGAWMDVIHKGKVVGITFCAGYQRSYAETSKLQVIRDIEPFQNIAVRGEVIGGRRQRRDMMRAHNLVEVGNERPMIHPRDAEDRRRERADPAIVERLKANSGGKWL